MSTGKWKARLGIIEEDEVDIQRVKYNPRRKIIIILTATRCVPRIE